MVRGGRPAGDFPRANPAGSVSQGIDYYKEHTVTRRIIKPIVVGALCLTAVLSASAAAVITESHGGKQESVDKRTGNMPFTTSNPFWSDLFGASLVVHVAENDSQLFDVPFFAESACAGPQTGACSVRIIATNLQNGQPVELNPQAGFDYAFDSDMPGAGNDLREGHGMERSIRLAGDADGGTDYQIEVQYGVTNPTTQFTLDDWHLAVEASD
jgi:hypothetical protein